MKESYAGYHAATDTFNHDGAWWDGVASAPRAFEIQKDAAADLDGDLNSALSNSERNHSLFADSFNITSIHNSGTADF